MGLIERNTGIHGYTEGIVDSGIGFMVVKIRFGRGPVVSRRSGKNSRIAMLAASLLTLVSISCASLGMWRIGTDLAWAGDFVFSDGLLSHWQVWMGVAASIQYAAWNLNRYAKKAVSREPEAEPARKSPEQVRAVANV
jgi:hypothetical protein